MKKTFSLIMLAMMMATGARAQKMLVRLADKQIVRYDISQVDYVTFLSDEFVDLELPSGTLWATCNLGACFPEEFGDYFAWGETEPKETYSNSNYKFFSGGQMSKYNATDGRTLLLTADDAATANLGSGWQMPSKEQWDELIDASNTTIEWTKENGVNGKKITSVRNGKSIFLPAAGDYTSMSRDVGKAGYYWSRSLNTENDWEACYLCFDYTSFIGTYYVDRFYGMSIRPVAFQILPNHVTAIKLNMTSLNLLVGGTRTLTATIEPEDAENKEVTWETSDASVATVSSDGLVTAQALGTCTITCSATDGSGVKAECQVNVLPMGGSLCPNNNHPHMIDLGLPSGTKWACCNVGASRPEEYGYFYAWGETEPKYIYNESTYKWWEYEPGSDVKGDYYKYTYDVKATRIAGDFVGGDGLRELEPADDAATANWGSNWQMPSRDQCRELKNNCACQYNTIRNGVHGTLITGPNGNSIFLPAAGTRWYKYYWDEGEMCSYWSRSIGLLTYEEANIICFRELDPDGWVTISNRAGGESVRPVVKQ